MLSIIRSFHAIVAILALTCGLGFFGASAPSALADEAAADLYYKIPGTPSGPAAPSPTETVYSRMGSYDSRLAVWFVTQQHTYFGGFVLALPLFCALLEFLGLLTNKPALSLRYDGLARDLAKVALLALSVTAVVGSLMLGMFVYLYPSFMRYMGGTFKAFMPAYAVVFLGESLLLILYYYSWNRMAEPGLKWIHAAIGILTNIFGTALLLLANSWAAFMMSPAGVDAQGRFLGNGWHLLHSALWNPLNVHRFLADIMSGGAVVLAYACYRFFTSKTEGERAYFDWVGYVFLFVTVCALLPMPIAGYWLMRSVYAFRQSMGVTMMGGLLTWLFVVQALLIGALLLGVNYYIWQSMARIKGGERYQTHYQFLVGALTLALFIWLTPHTVLMSAGEVKAMGGAQHPVVGNYGVMSAKNGAVNVMILITALSYLYYRRANRTMTTSCSRSFECDLALGLRVLFACESARRPFGAAGRHEPHRHCRQLAHQPRHAQRIDRPWSGAMGKDPDSRDGGAVRFSGGLYVGHGSDGVHSLLGAVVLARERVDGRCLTVGLYARARFRREDGHTQHDRVLECRPGVVLDVSAGAATGVERRMGRGVVANIGLGSSSGNLRCQKGTWRA
jgi:hypothetical protein